MKISLYNFVKRKNQSPTKYTLELHSQQEKKYDFYDKAKKLVLGTEDNFKGL